MKITAISAIMLCCFMYFTPVSSSASVPPPTVKIIPAGGIYKNIASLKVRDVQKLFGRKLTIKEKIGFLILKHRIKHPGDSQTGKGHTALIFGIVGLALFVAGLFIPFVILGSLIASILAIVTGSVAKKKDPSDRQAHAGKLLGWITLGLIAFLLLLAVVLIASWGWY